MDVAGIIPGAGSGSRLGADIPKALVPLAGKPLIVWAILRMQAAGISHITVAAPANFVADFQETLAGCGENISIVVGGATRQESVARALAEIESELVLIHDAARPLTPVSVINRVLAALRAGAPGVIPVLPVVDTIKQALAGEVAGQEIVAATLERSQLRAVQTPQGFQVDLLRQAHARRQALGDSSASDDSLLLEELGERVVMVPGAPESLKITTPFDLAVAELMASSGGDNK
ncbi:2-C-methyl-D-erythritol 4-phosphate cytidylyltransferase [uncultured Arcanobacterium sp.]|uniref:2-C-methyl-D-erythritol 4-phosphate cytidylyltransferase n=1 Tax=uncultured Arcanobacterium sp. TaxID=487520 RepID=UPI0026196107|nr:2-C-methyl-D-erythritol 4-phosphate cytidylyltransferase [uncultured Arcanobacterium sp.]